MDHNFGWNNAQSFFNNRERYQNFNSFQNFDAYQVNSFDCYNSYYASYPYSIDFSYSFENQYHNSYICNGVDKSLVQSNPSLLSLGLFKHFDDPTFEIVNNNKISCVAESIGWYEENAKRNIFIMEVQLVMHNGCLQVPPCVNFPTNHDSYLAIDDNFVSDEPTCLTDYCPILDNDKLDVFEVLPNFENNVELIELVDELEIDECPISIKEELKIDEIENLAKEYKDPVWEEFMSRSDDDYYDNFSSYFDYAKSLEHVRILKNFLYLYGSKVCMHIIILLLIRRYVHLFTFSPH